MNRMTHLSNWRPGDRALYRGKEVVVVENLGPSTLLPGTDTLGIRYRNRDYVFGETSDMLDPIN